MIMCKVIKGTIEKFTPTMAKVSIHQVQHVCGGRKSDLTAPGSATIGYVCHKNISRGFIKERISYEKTI